MKRLFKGVRYLSHLTFKEKLQILAIIWLAIRISLLVKYIPIRYYYKKYFQSTSDQTINLQLYIEEIGLIKRVLRKIPWKITCLVESLTIKRYFFRYGLDLPISIGIKVSNELSAHAWYMDENKQGFFKLNVS